MGDSAVSPFDEIWVLDTLWQFSTNPTSVSAGRAWRENFTCIAENLHVRYGLDESMARRLLEHAWPLFEDLTQRFLSISQIQDYLRSRAGEYGRRMAERMAGCSRATLCMIALLNHLRETGHDQYSLAQLFDAEQPPKVHVGRAMLRSILAPGEIIDYGLVQKELVTVGVLNRLFYRKCKGDCFYTFEFGMTIPDVSLTAIMGPGTSPDPREYVRMLFRDRRPRDARIIDLVSRCSYPFPGTTQWSRLMPDHPNASPGVLGVDYDRFGVAMAINPCIRKRICEVMSYAKKERVYEDVKLVEAVLQELSGRPMVTRLAAADGNVVWQVSDGSAPTVFAYLAPWIDHDFLRNVGGINNRDKVMFIMVEQDLSSMNLDLAEWRGSKRLVSLSGTKLEELHGYHRDEPSVFAEISALLTAKVMSHWVV